MEEGPDENTRAILSVMKTYSSSEVAIIGCHSTKIARANCEYDLVVVGNDPTPPKFVRAGPSFAEILFASEKRLRDPEPELAVALASAITLRDDTLLLASTVAESRRRFKESCTMAAESHLAAALKALGRVDALLGQKLAAEADLWLVWASVDFAASEVYSNLRVPSPSHTFSQMKSLSRKRLASFMEWSDASGFQLASRTSCENRLQALVVLYDSLKTTEMDNEMSLALGRYRSEGAVETLSAKANELLRSMDVIECYSYLGNEGVRTLVDLYRLHCRRIGREPAYGSVLADLTSGAERLISEELVKSLGFIRTAEMVSAGADSMRAAVSVLARKM